VCDVVVDCGGLGYTVGVHVVDVRGCYGVGGCDVGGWLVTVLA